MYRRVVVLLDGSPLAEQVMSFALQVAMAVRAELHLVTVVDADGEGRIAAATDGKQIQNAGTATLGVAEDYVKQVAGDLDGSQQLAHTHVLTGPVVESIEREVERVPDTLLAMTTHGRSGLGRAALGSVATKLVQSAKAPILLWRPSARRLSLWPEVLQTAIVPLDGSELAERILPAVQELATAMNLATVLVTVAPSLASMTFRYGAAGHYSIPQEALGPGRRALEQYGRLKAAELQSQGLGNTTARQLRGDPAQRIIGLARATRGSLIAISTHGRSGVGRWVMGSVADRVIRESRRPVLVVRSQAPG